MRLTIIKDDNKVIVNGEPHAVDCSGLPADFHALQWGGTRGEVEYCMTTCDHCNARSKKANVLVSDMSPFQPYVDRWNVAKVEAAEAARVEAEKRAADVAGQ